MGNSHTKPYIVDEEELSSEDEDLLGYETAVEADSEVFKETKSKK